MGRKHKVVILLLVLFGLWIFLAPLLAENLIVEKPLEKADAILVLSGSSVYQERTRRAAEVYRQGIAQKIYLTDDGEKGGWSVEEERNPPFVELSKRELIAHGVDKKDIEILKPEVTGTIWEARLLKEKLEKTGQKTILLVTSVYHTRRTLQTFETVLGKNYRIGIVASTPGERTPKPSVWWLTPRGWNYVAGEYVKSLVYWMYY